MDCKKPLRIDEMPHCVHATFEKNDEMPQHDCAVHRFTRDEFINKNLKETITITLEEYKELLVIKGKYEESKNGKNVIFPTYPNVPYKYPYQIETIPINGTKITC